MVDKSNEYGYVPSSPTQADGSNTGIFEVNDIVDLMSLNQWSLQDFGKLELIQTQTVSSVAAIDFTSIQESTYNIHFMTFNINHSSSANGGFQFYESGSLRTAADYQYAQHYGGVTGSFSSQQSTAISRIVAQNYFSGQPSVAYAYFYNLGDNTKYSYCTYQVWVGGQNLFMWGSGVSPLNSTVDGIRIYASASGLSGTASLYGLNES